MIFKELWLQPVEQHVAMQEAACIEEFELVLEDLKVELAKDSRPIIFDGYAPPASLIPLLPNTRYGFYLVCTEAFQLCYYEQRPWVKDVLAKTSEPDTAWSNWMERDSRSNRLLESQLELHGIPWLSVDGALSIDETVERVNLHFQGGHMDA